MVDPDTIKIIAASIVAEATTTMHGGLSTKDRKMITKEEKTQKWKNKMRKFDKK